MSDTCIFCGGGPVTQEHVFSKWLQEVFPQSKVGPAVASYIHGPPGAAPYNTFPTGRVATVTAGIVCATCNNVWMSIVEGAAQGLLTPMALGRPRTLDMQEQLTLATWAVTPLEAGRQNRLRTSWPEAHRHEAGRDDGPTDYGRSPGCDVRSCNGFKP